MGQLRDRMEQDLVLRKLSPSTRRNYLLYCRKFAAHYDHSPEQLGEAEIRAYLLYLIQVEQVAYATYRQNLAALKFLYTVTLGKFMQSPDAGKGQTDSIRTKQPEIKSRS